MSRASVLARGRVAAALGMQDACTIRRPSGSGTTDPVTGYPTQSYTTLYTGKCRVQQQAVISRAHDVGEDTVWVVRFDLQLPVDGSEGLAVEDQVTITAAVNDADLIGRTFIITELAHKSEATSRRVGMIERTGA
jgi:hypothetical protein